MQVLAEVDAIKYHTERMRFVVEGIFAGNMFDLGTSELAERYEKVWNVPLASQRCCSAAVLLLLSLRCCSMHLLIDVVCSMCITVQSGQFVQSVV